ncbi:MULTISPECIES: PRC-barrel domain-containing protein [Legionella]|uniref:PRC-barrel domain protein n=3 Tax=Legionella TaxID=445 RepID=A0A0W0XMB6_9GAMM|nr:MULTISPECIES: PRC-barrel domain-containing protein [Legionella]KTC99330.1 PRC-barrel domain protein [Legionella erythra]KTD45749.1 PRC-barrel domain protein [Legionella rubrilucens]QRN04884.1 PRC-barrel domain containing protein [Legionella sp. MW5194]RJT45888.1 PRC-barrel domain containing protein [Legionella taurinensis]RJT66386.1 PRC-barrel domain containing protein [Legionella taurinensis]
MTSLIVNANDVIGAEVRNLQDEDLGKIEALMIDKLDGHVAYVVLSFGGLFGMGDKLFALPWSTFSYDKENECYIINISKERLKNSPGFDKDHWPDMSSPNWSTTIHNYYGTTQQ